MADQRAKRASAGGRASRAEIDGLATVTAESLAMAERLRSEAASALLRRALARLQDLGRDADPGTAVPRGFMRS